MILRHIVLSLSLATYCMMILSPPSESYEVNLADTNQSGKVYLTELSKLLFPQHINPDGYSLSVVCIENPKLKEVVHPFLVEKQLGFKETQAIKDYFVETVDFTLKFPPEDIVYPFYDFW